MNESATTVPTELPPFYSFMSRPRFQSSEDCMGNPISQWVQAAMTPHPSKNLILGVAETEAAVTEGLIKQCWDDYNFHRLSEEERLKALVQAADDRGRFYDRDLVDVIKLLANRKGPPDLTQ